MNLRIIQNGPKSIEHHKGLWRYVRLPQLLFDEIRVETTYAAVAPFTKGGIGQAPKISIGRSGAQLEISWTQGTLESATSVTGPWPAVPSATAPSYKVTPDPTPRYFRVRQ